MLRVCALFNMLAGVVGVVFCVGFGALAIGLGGVHTSLESLLDLAMVIGWLGLAGLLYVWSGVILWKCIPAIPRQCLVLIGCTLVCGIAHGIQNFGFVGDAFVPGQSWDEEIIMFVITPMAVFLLIALQFEYLRRRSRRQRSKMHDG